MEIINLILEKHPDGLNHYCSLGAKAKIEDLKEKEKERRFITSPIKNIERWLERKLAIAVLVHDSNVASLLIKSGARIANENDACPISLENIYKISDPCIISNTGDRAVYSKNSLEDILNRGNGKGLTPITREEFCKEDILPLDLREKTSSRSFLCCLPITRLRSFFTSGNRDTNL